MTDWTMWDDIQSLEFQFWSSRILMALLITLAIWGMSSCYQAGKREMLAEPPQVIVDKSHTVSSYSCGRDCITNSDNWTLLNADGEVCNVTRVEYARAKVGQEWKCMQLFGWQ